MEHEGREVTSAEARRQIRQLLNSVEHDGAHIVIRRYDTPAAVIVPVGWYEQARAKMEGGER